MAEVITECTCGQIEPGMPPDVIDVITVTPSPEMRAAVLAAAGLPDLLAEPCEGCDAEAGEECDLFCTGRAAYLDAQADARTPLDVLASLADQWEAGDVDPDMVTAHIGAMVAEIRELQGAQS